MESGFSEGQGVVHQPPGADQQQQRVGFAFSSFGAFELWMKRQFMRIKDNYQPSLLWNDDMLLLVDFDQSSIEYVPRDSVSTLQEFSLRHSAQEFEQVLNPLLENGKVVVNSAATQVQETIIATTNSNSSSSNKAAVKKSTTRAKESRKKKSVVQLQENEHQQTPMDDTIDMEEPVSEAATEQTEEQHQWPEVDETATPRHIFLASVPGAQQQKMKEILTSSSLSEEKQANRIKHILIHACGWVYLDKVGNTIAPPRAQSVQFTMEDIFPILRAKFKLAAPERRRRQSVQLAQPTQTAKPTEKAQAPQNPQPAQKEQAPQKEQAVQKAQGTQEPKPKKSASKTPAVVDKRTVKMKVSANKKPVAQPSATQRYTRRKGELDELTSDEHELFMACWKILKFRGWTCQYQYVGPIASQEEVFAVPEADVKRFDTLQNGMHYHSKKDLVALASTYPWLWQLTWDQIWDMLQENGWMFKNNQFVMKNDENHDEVLGLNTFASPNHVIAFISRFPYLATFDQESAALLFDKEQPPVDGILSAKFLEAHRPLFELPAYTSHACVTGTSPSLAVNTPILPSVDGVDYSLEDVVRLVIERQINFESEEDVRLMLLSYCGWSVAEGNEQCTYISSRTTFEAVEQGQARHLEDYFQGWDELHDALINHIVALGYDLNTLCTGYVPCTQGSPDDMFTITKRVDNFSDDEGSTVGLADLYDGRTKQDFSDAEVESIASDPEADLRVLAAEILTTVPLPTYADGVRKLLRVYDWCDNPDDREAVFQTLFSFLKHFGWSWDYGSKKYNCESSVMVYLGPTDSEHPATFLKSRDVVKHLKHELNMPLRTPEKVSTAEKPRRAALRQAQPIAAPVATKRKAEAVRAPPRPRVAETAEEFENQADENIEAGEEEDAVTEQEELHDAEEGSEEEEADPKALAAEVLNTASPVEYEHGVRQLLGIYDKCSMDDKPVIFQVLLSFLERFGWTWDYGGRKYNCDPAATVYIAPGGHERATYAHGVDVFVKEREVVKHLKEELDLTILTPDRSSVTKSRRRGRAASQQAEPARPVQQPESPRPAQQQESSAQAQAQAQHTPVHSNKRPHSASDCDRDRKRVSDEQSRFQTPEPPAAPVSPNGSYHFRHRSASVISTEESEVNPLDDGYEQLYNWQFNGKPFDPKSPRLPLQRHVENWLTKDGWSIQSDAIRSMVYFKPNVRAVVASQPELEGVQYFRRFTDVWGYIVKKFDRRRNILEAETLDFPSKAMEAELAAEQQPVGTSDQSTEEQQPMEMGQVDEPVEQTVAGGSLRDAIEAAKTALVTHSASQDVPAGRENEYREVMRFLAGGLDTATGGALYMCGAAGTGKTLVTTSALHRIQTAYHGLNIVVVNGASSVNLASRLADELGVTYEAGDDNDARTKLFAALVPRRSKGGHARSAINTVICVDEIDNAPRDLARQLFEGASSPQSQYLLVGIANTRQYLVEKVQLSPDVRVETLVFETYTFEKLVDILTSRTNGLFDPKALEYIARRATKSSGDCRKALETAHEALRLIERSHASLDEPFTAERPIVNTKHLLDMVKSQGAGTSRLRDLLKSFDSHVKLLLVAAATGFGDLSRAYSVQQIYEQYINLCTILGTTNPPLNEDTLDDNLSSLSSYGFATLVVSYGRLGRRSDSRAYKFTYSPEELRPHMEGVLASHLEKAIARQQSPRV